MPVVDLDNEACHHLKADHHLIPPSQLAHNTISISYHPVSKEISPQRHNSHQTINLPRRTNTLRNQRIPLHPMQLGINRQRRAQNQTHRLTRIYPIKLQTRIARKFPHPRPQLPHLLFSQSLRNTHTKKHLAHRCNSPRINNPRSTKRQNNRPNTNQQCMCRTEFIPLFMGL